MSTPNDPTPINNTNPPTTRSTSLSRSRPRTGSSPPPRPTTPLRPPSRSSFRSSHNTPVHPNSSTPSPFTTLEPAFAELSDSMADLEANFVHLQLMHESLSRFNECFASFLYGCNVNAFCVDFPEAPVSESFKHARQNPAFDIAARDAGMAGGGGGGDGGLEHGRKEDREGEQGDQTFLTNETSFVENPPSAQKVGRGRDVSEKFTTPGKKLVGSGRGARGGAQVGNVPGAGRGQQSRGRASGLARATGRGRGGTRG